MSTHLLQLLRSRARIACIIDNISSAHVWTSCRAWRACQDPSADLQQAYAAIGGHFAAESLLEGLPLTLLAFSWLYMITDPCQFVTCDPATISATFPDHVLTLPDSPRPLSAAEVAALQGSSCSALPLTADGWFTLPYSSGRPGQDLTRRATGFLERIIEFPIDGATPLLSRDSACLSGPAMSPIVC